MARTASTRTRPRTRIRRAATNEAVIPDSHRTCGIAIPVAVLAGSGEGFDGVVHSIESKYHIHATRIPFLGIVSLISRKATHGGVNGLHLAEFEHLSGPVDRSEEH